MNTETGKVYEGADEVAAARARGEALVPIGSVAARKIKAGRRLLAQTIGAQRRKARSRRRDAMARASRRANR